MIRPARMSSVRNSIVAAAMSAGVSTGGRAASSAGVIRPRDRREAGVSTSPGQMQLARTPIVSPLGDSGAYPIRTPCHQGGRSLKIHHRIVGRGTDNSAEQVRMS